MPELHARADAFLETIALNLRSRLPGRGVVAVLAHPDDAAA